MDAETFIYLDEQIESAWSRRAVDRSNAVERIEQVLSQLDQMTALAPLDESAQKIAHRRAKANVVNTYLLLRDNEYVQALSEQLAALPILEEWSEQLWIGRGYNNLGLLYSHMGAYTDAIGYLNRQVKIGRTIGNQELVLLANHNLGRAYMQLEDYSLAADFFKRSQAESTSREDIVLYTYGVTSLAECRIQLEQFEQAKAELADCMQIAVEANERHAESVVLRAQGEVEEAQGNYDAALQLYLRSTSLNDAYGNLYTGILLSLAMGRVYLAQRRSSNAVAALQDALGNSTRLGERNFVYQAHQYLAEAFSQTGRVDKALGHFKEFHSVKESVLSLENKTRLAQLELLHQAQRAFSDEDDESTGEAPVNYGPDQSDSSLADSSQNSYTSAYQAMINQYELLRVNIGTAAHEIRSQLTIIQIYSGVLSSPNANPTAEKKQTAHRKIKDAIEQINRWLESAAPVEESSS